MLKPCLRHLSAVLTGVALCASLSAQNEANPISRIVALQVVSEIGEDTFDGPKPMNSDPGIKLSVLVEVPNSKLIEIDDKETKVTAFSDDKGNDLLARDASFGGARVGFFSKVSKDGTKAIINFQTPAVPAPEATSLNFQATAILVAGSKTEELRSEAAAPDKGAKFEAGAFALTIKSASKPDWGDDKWQIKFASKRALDDIKEIRVADASGEVHETSMGGSGRTSAFGKLISETREVKFKKKPEGPILLVIERWTDLEKIEVPVELKIDVGVGG